MKQVVTRFLAGGLTACTLLGSGCAASYTPIMPERIVNSQAITGPSGLSYAYQFDALQARGRNKKYAKKEHKQGYHVVALRVTNNTPAEVNFSRDAVLYYGDRPVVPVTGEVAGRDMKQGVAIYLLYLPLNFTVGATTTTNGYGQTTTTGGTYLPTGPFIAGGNMLGAALANKNFREDLSRLDLTNRSIRPGETVYGVVCLRETNVAPLRLELRTVAATSPAPAAQPGQLPTPAGMPLPPATSPARN